MANTSRNVAELEIEDIEGIGPTTARKMKEAGISSVMELATAVPEELATDLGGSKETARYLHHGSSKAAKGKRHT